MVTDWLRQNTHKFLVPVADLAGRMGISANALTITGSVLHLGVAAVIASGHIRAGGLLLVFASAFDAIDGTLARQLGRPTKFGAFLDSCMDRVSESAVLIGLAWWYIQQANALGAVLAYITIVGAMMVSYTRARGEGLGVDCKVGLFTRVERAIVMVLGLVSGLVLPMLWIMAVGTCATAAHRAFSVYSRLGDQPL